jgi:hypothetical protein
MSSSEDVRVYFNGNVSALGGPVTATVEVKNSQNSDVSVLVTVRVLAPMVSLTLTPNPVVLTAATPAVQLVATAMRSDGSIQDVTASAGFYQYNNDVASLGSGSQDNTATAVGRGATSIHAKYLTPTSWIYGQTEVCSLPPQTGTFGSSQASSNGPTLRREVLSQFLDRVTLLDEDDDDLNEWFIDKEGGDQIVVYWLNRQYLVVVRTDGDEEYTPTSSGIVHEDQDGNPATDARDDNEGLKYIYIFNAKHSLGYREERSANLSEDLKESDEVSVLFSPDGQFVNLKFERSWRGAQDEILFYTTFDQNMLVSRSPNLVQGTVYNASVSFDTGPCTGSVQWTIDNPPGSFDMSGNQPFVWPPN